MRQLWLAAVIAVVGCKSTTTPTTFGVNLTVDAGSLSVADRGRVVQMIVTYRGVETGSKTFDVSSVIRSGPLRGRYIPAAHAGTLVFWIDAVDASGAIVATGKSSDVSIVDGAAANVSISLMAFNAPTALGQACGISRECDSAGSCVDGICCDSECADNCMACNLAGAIGRCTPVPSGQAPVHGSCEPPSCDVNSNRFTPGQVCDGKGACAALASYDCAPYKCKDSAGCFSTCSDATQCSGGNSCVASSCGLLSNGRMCTDGAQCNSGYCVDGVCCNGSCSAQCEACDIPNTGGVLGTCTTVATGAPHKSHLSCLGSGTLCAGSCGGSTATQCTYPTTSCGGSMCSGTMEVDMLCNTGACGAVAKSCMPGFACGTNSCSTMCDVVTNAGCDTNYVCASGTACLKKVAFGSVVSATVGQNPIAVAAGLFDADSFNDLATADSTSSTMTVLHGNGDGTFAATSMPDAGVTSPTSVAAADIDGDGKSDIVYANGDNNLTVMTNVGGGSFSWTHPASGSTPSAVAVANFDADPKLDVAVANSVVSGTVTVLVNNGTGFTLKSTPTVGTQPNAIAAADLNADTKNDLVVSNGSSDNLSVLLGNGDGTFTLKSSPPTGSHPTAVAIGDVTGDGVPDIVVTNSSAVTLTVLQGAGDGTFTFKSNPSVGMGAISIAMADFNRDGKKDLAVVNFSATMTLLLGAGDGTFPYKTTFAVPMGARYVIAAELNNDTRPDLVTANGTANSVSALLNTSP